MSFEVTAQTFVYAALLFAALIACQIVVWRWHSARGVRVKKQILCLFAIYLGGPLLALAFTGDVAGTLLVLSHSVTYVLIFPAAAAKSPSFEILLLVAENPGITEAQIQERIGQGRLLADRLRDLSDDGLVKGDESLSLAGRSVAAFFLAYRRMLGIPMGSG